MKRRGLGVHVAAGLLALAVEVLDQRLGDHRPVHGRLVGLERALAQTGEDLVFGCRLEAHALGLRGRAPAVPALQAHRVAAAHQLCAERDRREDMPGGPEGGEEEAPPQRFAQTSSASSRIIFTRASGSKAIGVVMSVPTPASR